MLTKEHTKPEYRLWLPKAFTVRIETAVVHQLDQLADSLDRSRNYLVNQELKEYLEQHAWQFEKITQSLGACDRSELTAHEEIMKEMEVSNSFENLPVKSVQNLPLPTIIQ